MGYIVCQAICWYINTLCHNKNNALLEYILFGTNWDKTTQWSPQFPFLLNLNGASFWFIFMFLMILLTSPLFLTVSNTCVLCAVIQYCKLKYWLIQKYRFVNFTM